MTGLGAVVKGPSGLSFEEREVVKATNNTGTVVALGEIVRFDFSVYATLGMASLEDPAGDEHEIVGVVVGLRTGAGADTTEVDVCIRGVCKAKAGAAGVSAGDALTYQASATAGLIDIAQDAKCVAFALETIANGATGDVLFNGVEGFGHKSSA